LDKIHLDKIHLKKIYLDKIHSNKIHLDNIHSNKIHLDKIHLYKHKSVLLPGGRAEPRRRATELSSGLQCKRQSKQLSRSNPGRTQEPSRAET
jgi:hypothetical protein